LTLSAHRSAWLVAHAPAQGGSRRAVRHGFEESLSTSQFLG